MTEIRLHVGSGRATELAGPQSAPHAADLSLSDLFRGFMSRRNVSWRRYGLNGEHRRPIFHRFDIKGGDTGADVARDSITRSNPLLKRLMSRGK